MAQLPVPSALRSRMITGLTSSSFSNRRGPPHRDQRSIAAEPLSMRTISGELPQDGLASRTSLNSTVRGLPQPIFRLPIVSRRSRDLLS
jgi:hypothetical protein